MYLQNKYYAIRKIHGKKNTQNTDKDNLKMILNFFIVMNYKMPLFFLRRICLACQEPANNGTSMKSTSKTSPDVKRESLLKG